MIIGNKNERSLDNPCTLVGDGAEREVLCAEIPTHSSEFFKASQQGIQVSRTLVVNSDEYCCENKCIYDGTAYRIYRYYPMSDGFTELYLEERMGV